MKRRKKEQKSVIIDDETIENKSQEAWEKISKNPGMTIQEAVGIPNKTLEEIYSLAYSYYIQNRYKEAVCLFELLAYSAPNTYHYVLGLGAAYRELGSLEQALGTLMIAFQLKRDDPIAPYYMMETLISLDQTKEALEYAELTQLICKDRPEYANYQERCRLVATSLKEKNNQ